MFKNFTIQKKLLSGFLAVAVLAAIIGLYGSAKLKSLNKNDQFLYEVSTAPLGELIKMSTDFQKVRILNRDMIKENNPEAEKKYIEQTDNLVNEIESCGQKYEKSISTEKGKELFDQYASTLKDWKSQNARFNNLILGNKNAEANYELKDENGNFVNSSKNIEKSINQLIDNKIERGKLTVDENKSQANHAVIFLCLILLLVIILAVFLGSVISSNINGINNSLLSETKKLVNAATEGKLAYRADVTKIDQEFRAIPEGFNKTFDIIVNKINWYEQILDALPFPIHVTDKDMKWTFMNKAFEKLMIQQGVIKNRQSGYGMACSNAGANICNTQNCGIRQLLMGKTESFFDWCGMKNKQDTAFLKDINGETIGYVESVSDLTPIISVKDYTATEVKRIENNLQLLSKGDLNFDLQLGEANNYTETVHDQFQTIFESLKEVKEAIGSLIEDTVNLSTDAVEGKLSSRADTTKHQGDYRKIIEGINLTLDSMIVPIQSAIKIIDQIAKGIIPSKVTSEQKGDFNLLKISINQCIDGLNGLAEANNVLQKMAVNDYSGNVEGHYEGIYAEVAEACSDLQRNFKHVVQIALNISKGDFCDLHELETTGKRSENDTLVPSFINVEKALVMITEKAKLIANGDLTVSLERLSDKDELMLALSNMVTRLNEIVASIMEAAHNVATSSNEMSTAAVQISEGVSEQSSSAEEVSSSMEEMTSTIQQNSDNANQTEQIAKKSAQGIIDVNEASGKSLDAMRQISEKIKIINDIASKTDILAINAAIEAARAGEQGKGFAVVAAEIRKLAEVSQNAAVEINSLSVTSLKITEETGSLMEKIIPEIQKTAQLIQEVAVSSNEQKTGSEEITKAIVQFSQVTQQNAAAAEEMSSNSEELASQAELLKETIGFFNTGKQMNETKQKLSHISSKSNYKRNQIPSAERKGINLNLENSEVNDDNFEKY